MGVVYLKKVSINGNDYYYLFHTIREGEKFRKVSKYIGKEIPNEIEEIKKDFLAQIKSQPLASEDDGKVNVIEVLHDLQEKEGYLSRDSMMKLAKEFDIPGVDIYGVATFYSLFKLKKPGQYRVAICTGTACHVKGSDKLLAALEESLKIRRGETSKDGKVTLEAVNCIGACAKAPAMMVNDIVYGELTDESMKKIVQSLK